MPILRIDDCSSINHAKLVLVEMQGVLETDGSELQSLSVGQLQLNQTTPMLTIGKQRLKGSIVKLKKPLVILDTKPDPDTGAAAKIVQILEEKIVFNSRPLTVFDKA